MKSEATTFFLTGSVRSGTTLLRLLLGHHPQFEKCQEMDYVTTYLLQNRNSLKIGNYWEYLQFDRGFQKSGNLIDQKLDYNELVRSFLLRKLEANQRTFSGATVHHDFALLPDLFPVAKYIYLLRDPREVARSCVNMGWAGLDWYGAQFWVNAQSEWEALKKVVPEERRLEVRFEDLVRDSERVLSQICAFLGTDFDPAMLEIEENTTYQRPDPSKHRSWRSFTPFSVRQVEARVTPGVLAGCGYEVSMYPPLSNKIAMRIFIRILNFLLRVKYNISRYGLNLWFVGVLSRRMGGSRWQRNVQLQIDDLTNSQLK